MSDTNIFFKDSHNELLLANSDNSFKSFPEIGPSFVASELGIVKCLSRIVAPRVKAYFAVNPFHLGLNDLKCKLVNQEVNSCYIHH